MINHYVRFAPPFARLKALVDEGYLGRLMVADALILTNPIDYLNSSAWSDRKAGWYTNGADHRRPRHSTMAWLSRP